MSNEITSMLQSLRPQHKVPGQARKVQVPGQARATPDVPVSGQAPAISQVPGKARGASGQAPGASRPAVTEKPATSQVDRVTLSESARQLRLAESKPGPGTVVAPQSNSSDVGMNYTRHANHVQPAANRLPAEGGAQRPSPAMANMLEAFFTTSDMEGFNADSDLNADGVINFQDLAALRDIETGVGTVPPETPETLLNNMTGSFFSSEGDKGFDAASDLSGDGVINFQDLAMLRSKLENN